VLANVGCQGSVYIVPESNMVEIRWITPGYCVESNFELARELPVRKPFVDT
jgi:hypothetical protein